MLDSELSGNVSPMADSDKNAEAVILRIFADADATVSWRAKTAAELGLEPSIELKALTDRGMVRSPGGQPDRLYIPLLSGDLFMTPLQRRLAFIPFVIVVIFCVVLAVLYFLNPHAFHALMPVPQRHF